MRKDPREWRGERGRSMAGLTQKQAGLHADTRMEDRNGQEEQTENAHWDTTVRESNATIGWNQKTSKQ